MADYAKRPLMAGQYVIAVSKKDGKFRVIIGPDSLEATDDDIFMVPGSDDPSVMTPVDHANKAVSNFVTLRPDEYAVLHSPSEQSDPDYPNGRFQSGRNEMKSLLHGRKRVITAGHFPLWPGQWVEIRKRHLLTSNQYLMVAVESAVDALAPYYHLTVQCAGIKTAVIDDKTADGQPTAELSGVESAPASASDAAATEPKVEPRPSVSSALEIGRRIIIPGSMTPTYIPPTGIEIIVPAPGDARAAAPSSGAAKEGRWGGVGDPRSFLRERIESGRLGPDELRDLCERAGIPVEDFGRVEEATATSKEAKNKSKALSKSIETVLDDNSLTRLARMVLDAGRRRSAVIPDGTTDSASREAIELGPTEFCVLLDEEGNQRFYKGPGRVFPGPRDTVRTQGSHKGVYGAYHLRSDRGLLLRVLAERMTRADLLRDLPEESRSWLEKETYRKGDEIFIGGFDAYIVPTANLEVRHPVTRQPHIGNDHSEVYVQAIGVDQKSGVYVADVATGSVRLVRGEKKLLLDPRKERHVKRRVPGKRWNLIIGRGESHKTVPQEAMIESPWALSVTVPNNEAILVTSRDGRRVVVGPKTELLDYEEWLEGLELSRGRPKREDDAIDTCFLRVTGNRVTDQVELETSDFVKVVVDLCYGVRFVGEAPEEREKWFNHKNYVWLLATSVRSRLRAAARTRPFTELIQTAPVLIRDTILGAKPADGARSGLLFREVNMLVDEVEVLEVTLPDEEVAESLAEVNREIVRQKLSTTSKQVELAAQRALDEIETSLTEIERARAERERDLSVARKRARHEADAEAERLDRELSGKRQSGEHVLEKARETSRDEIAALIRARSEASERSKIALRAERDAKETEARARLAEIEKELAAALASADAKRLGAIQPRLVEAIEALGNKELASALAENLPRAGGSVGMMLDLVSVKGLKTMFEGTPLARGLEALVAPNGRNGDNGPEAIETTPRAE
jgi:major vault protein